MAELDIALLEKLSNSFGPSGFEIDPLRLMKEAAKGYADEFMATKLYSLVFNKKGAAERPKVLMAGHVDEIGFCVNSFEDGYLTFLQLGGWWDQSLLTQSVLVRTRKGDYIEGVIAAKPPHILDPEEAKKVVTKDKMFIDVGCASDDEVKDLGIRTGDPIVPDSKFRLLTRKRIKKNDDGKKETREVNLALGKAFDDRIGAFVALEVLKRLGSDHPNTYYGAATTQEEVGLRGARTTTHLVQPDVAFALEVDIAGDVPGVPKTKALAKMSEGCSILTYDGSMIPNTNLVNFAIDTAEEEDIKYQLSQIPRGGTDAGAFHVLREGCPSLVIGIPTRHIHSHNGILDLADVEEAVKLCTAMVKKLDEKTVKSFTEF
ncbi:MAG: M42 family metallopeptidase [Candidatus Hodarchaeales archaeon]|jgi:endoglucanase